MSMPLATHEDQPHNLNDLALRLISEITIEKQKSMYLSTELAIEKNKAQNLKNYISLLSMSINFQSTKTSTPLNNTPVLPNNLHTKKKVNRKMGHNNKSINKNQ